MHRMLGELDSEPTVFEPEFDLSELSSGPVLPFEVEKVERAFTGWKVPGLKKCWAILNIDSEKGFEFSRIS